MTHLSRGLGTRSMRRPKRSDNSVSGPVNFPIHGPWSSSLKTTRKSTSLSGPKSSRSTEPKTDNSSTWYLSQSAAIASIGSVMWDRIASVLMLIARPPRERPRPSTRSRLESTLPHHHTDRSLPGKPSALGERGGGLTACVSIGSLASSDRRGADHPLERDVFGSVKIENGESWGSLRVCSGSPRRGAEERSQGRQPLGNSRATHPTPSCGPRRRNLRQSRRLRRRVGWIPGRALSPGADAPGYVRSPLRGFRNRL